LNKPFFELYTLIKTSVDGNCLFNAVSIGIIGNEELSIPLRFAGLSMIKVHKNKYMSHIINSSNNSTNVYFDNENGIIKAKPVYVAMIMGTTS